MAPADATMVAVRLKRDLVAKLWWGAGGGLAALVMALLLGFSLVTNLSFYLEGETASIIVFCAFLAMASVSAVWLSGRVELRHDELVAGWRLMPQRIARYEIQSVRIAQVEPEPAATLGVQLLIDDSWTDLRLSIGLDEDLRMEWARLISGWSGCEIRRNQL